MVRLDMNHTEESGNGNSVDTELWNIRSCPWLLDHTTLWPDRGRTPKWHKRVAHVGKAARAADQMIHLCAVQ